MLNVITASTFRSRGFQINLSHTWWGCCFGFISYLKFLIFVSCFIGDGDGVCFRRFGAARSENIVCICIRLKSKANSKWTNHNVSTIWRTMSFKLCLDVWTFSIKCRKHQQTCVKYYLYCIVIEQKIQHIYLDPPKP